MWKEFVEECAIGYELDLSEYLNDLSIRDLLQEVMDDAEIRTIDNYGWFAEEVRRIDERFREVVNAGPEIRPDDAHWWKRRVPPVGAEEFVDDVRDRHSVEVRVVDR